MKASIKHLFRSVFGKKEEPNRTATYLITDTNISGSGGGLDDCAQVIVQVNSGYDLAKSNALREELNRIKHSMSITGDCLDSDDLITDACDAVFGEGQWTALGYASSEF